MTPPEGTRGDGWIACGLSALTVGLFLIVGMDWAIPRDDAIYLYGGVRMLEGDLPYTAIFDHKGPGAQALAGLGIAIGRVFGAPDWLGARGLFAAMAALVPALVFLILRQAGAGRAAAILGAIIVPAVSLFDATAVAGPRPKIAFVLFEALTIWAAARRSWALAGLFCALATLVWQPGILFAPAVLWAAPAGDRGRALIRAGIAGLAVAALAVLPYAVTGQMRALLDGMVIFNLTDIARFDDPGLVSGVQRILATGWRGLGPVSGLLAVGLGWAIWQSRAPDPARRATGGVAILMLAWSIFDLQGAIDLLPLLPPAAIGLGLGARRLFARLPARSALGATALVALAGWANAVENAVFLDGTIGQQARRAEALTRLCDTPGCLYFLGDTPGLALSGIENPSRYGFVLSGIGGYIARTEPGGIPGWLSAVDAEFISVGLTRGPGTGVIEDWLRAHYSPAPGIDPLIWRRTATRN